MCYIRSVAALFTENYFGFAFEVGGTSMSFGRARSLSKQCYNGKSRHFSTSIVTFWYFHFFLRIQVYLVIYDSGSVSLEHLLLSRHPSQSLSRAAKICENRSISIRECSRETHNMSQPEFLRGRKFIPIHSVGFVGFVPLDSEGNVTIS